MYQLGQDHLAELHRRGAHTRDIQAAKRARRTQTEDSKPSPRRLTTLTRYVRNLLTHRAATH